jgi:hypothetical protein
MSLWGAVVGGFAGTLVLTTALSGASAMGFTRMDIPFLLGTAFTANRTRAKVVGYGLHFVFGLVFALGYYGIFAVIGHAGWLAGAMFGFAHGLFAGTALVNVLLPAVHPLMGSDFTAADSAPFLESPGFMMLNYGRTTPIVTLLAHMAYGAIVGGFIALAR